MAIGSCRPLACLTMLIACAGEAPPHAEQDSPSPSLVFPASRFDEHFRALDTVKLEETRDDPLVRISGIAMGPDRTLVLTDVSESAVRLYSVDGRISKRLGRKGSGPGEFRYPFRPHFDRLGRVHIADAVLMRITVFDLRSDSVRTVSLSPGFVRVLDFGLLEDGAYLIAGARTGANQDGVFRLDSTGAVQAAYLPFLATVIPRGAARSPYWDNVRRTSIAMTRNGLLAVNTLMDSLWMVDLRSEALSAVRLRPDGYVPPTPPEKRPQDVPTLLKWTRTLMLVSTIITSDRAVYVPFVRGIYHEGAPNLLAYRSEGGDWSTLLSAPPILAASGDTVITMIAPADAPGLLVRFVRRQ